MMMILEWYIIQDPIETDPKLKELVEYVDELIHNLLDT